MPSGIDGMPIGGELSADSCGPSPRCLRPRLAFPRPIVLCYGGMAVLQRLSTAAGTERSTHHPGLVTPALRVGRGRREHISRFHAAECHTGDRKAI